MRRPLWILPLAVGGAIMLFAALHASNPDGRSARHPLGDFHRWTKLNPQPALLDNYVDELCRSTSEIEQHQRKVDPHAYTYINVYVNDNGVKEMKSGADLPVGTVIVKEKLASPEGPPVMSTAMVKREPGYNPTCGDWEFETLDAKGAHITSSGRNENCMSCHSVHKRNDHTFRFYLPKTIDKETGHTYVNSGGWEIFPDCPYDY